MLERDIQARLIRKYQKEGYYVLRLVQVSKAGIPDLLLIKDGVASFVEVKARNGVISDKQRQRAIELREVGCSVRFVTEGDVDINEGRIEISEQYGF
jgi:Holliday junction resolvase-like predicted endonuclease